MLREDLAELYGVGTKVLVQAVKRSTARFPQDFTRQLSAAKWSVLRSRSVTLEPSRGRHSKYLPYAFTEPGVAMLSWGMRSPRAVAVNIEILRAFVAPFKEPDPRAWASRLPCAS
jgi:hypothetical protein